MSHYPLEPSVARLLIESTRRGCVDDALTVAAMLSVESVFYRPTRRDGEAHGAIDPDALESHIDLFHAAGDHVTYLKIFDLWTASGNSEQWCKDRCVDGRCALLGEVWLRSFEC